MECALEKEKKEINVGRGSRLMECALEKVKKRD